MKRLIVALLVGGVMFGTVFAVAAALNVNTGTLQAGGETDLSCDDAVDVFINGAWSNTASAYVVTGVIVTDIDTECGGGTIKVTLTKTGGDLIEEMILGGIGTSATLNTTTTVKVEDLEDIHVLIATT